MARAFRREGAHLVAHLDEIERSIVGELLGDVAALLDDGAAPQAGTGGGTGGGTDDDAVLRDLAADLAGPQAPGAPTDPALHPLLPDAAPDDPQVQSEFRRFTEAGLRRTKRRHLRLAAGSLQGAPGPLRLDDDQAQAWMRALTDVRLVLGERLQLRTDADAEALEDELDHLAAGDVRSQQAALYDFLTWLQETLAGALLAEMDPAGREGADDHGPGEGA